MSIRPLRFSPVDVAPGGPPIRFTVTARNRTDKPVTIRTLTALLRGSSDPTRLVQAVRSGSASGPATWISFPYAPGSWPSLDPGTSLDIPATLRVPGTATPGTYALALTVSQVISAGGVDTGDGSSATAVRLNAGVASEVVINVTGDVTADARIQSIDAPRLVTSGERPVFAVRVEDTGNTQLRFDAETSLSPFWGAAGRVLRADAQDALPQGVRVLRMQWGDPPLIGWYRPHLTVVGGDGSGVRITRELPIVWVIPPWWILLALVVAIALPVRHVMRRRRSRAERSRRRGRARSRVEERLRIAEAKQRAAQARRDRR